MPFILLAAVLAFLGGAAEARTKRDTPWVPSDPRAFELKLGFDRIGRHVIDIGMGSPFAQAGNFTFLLSTSSPYSGVAAVGCTACVAQLDGQIYNISQSSSAVNQGITQSLTIGKGIITGPVIRESCTLTKADGSKWKFDNQSIIMVQNTEGIFGNGSLGLLGLGRSSGNDSYLSGVLKSRGWNSVLLGLAVNPYNSTANATTEQLGGSLNFQELNSNLYSGEVSWQPTAKVTNAPANIPTDWALQFDSYQMSFGSRTTFSSGGGATIDPFFPEFMIPGSEATDFFGSVPNAKMSNDSTILSWVVPCDQEFAVAITIGNNTIRVKKEQLIDSTGTVCTSLVKGWADSRVRSYLFGRPFAASAYIAYNAVANPSSDQIGVASRPDNDNTPIIIQQGVSSRTVVISVVASILGVAIVAAFLFFFIRWWRHRSCTDTLPSNQKPKDHDVIQPFTLPPLSATPLISVTGGGGWVIEQGPIGGESSAGSTTLHERSSAQYNRMRDNKSPLPLPSPNVNLVRQSDMTFSSGLPPSPEPSPHPETHPLMSTSAGKSQFPAEPQQYENPDIPDGVAPPPYERNQAL